MSQALHEEGGVLKVHRYRPGEVPQYAKHLEEELKPNAKEHRLSLPRPRTREREHREQLSARADREEATPREATQAEDVERRRRAAAESDESEDEGTTRVVARAAQRRRPIEPTVIVHAKTDVKEQAKKAPRVVLPQPQAESSSDEEDEDSRARRRAMLRRRLEEEEEEEGQEEEGGGEARVTRRPTGTDGMDVERPASEESSSEYETDSSEDSDDGYKRPVIVPIFVRKELRDTVKEKEIREAEAQKALELEEERKVERAKESQAMALEMIRQDAVEQNAAAVEDDGGDIDEGIDEQEEYEKWKERELARIKRDQEERTRMQKEKEETEARRKMTDEEIRALDPHKYERKQRDKRKFMQKYYHKGAFFQDVLEGDEKVKTMNFGAATGEDKLERSVLPEVMQVKNFGKKGRTKYTHLVDQDTTRGQESMWAMNDKLRVKYEQMMGGMGPLQLPGTKRKRSDDGRR